MTNPTVTEAEVEAARARLIEEFAATHFPSMAQVRAALHAAARVRPKGVLGESVDALAAQCEAAEARAEKAEAERDALRAGLSSIVHCQSPITRSQMREAASEFLKGDVTRLWSASNGGNQSPWAILAIERTNERDAANERIGEWVKRCEFREAERDVARAQANALAGALQPWAFSHKSITASWPDDAIVNVTNGATILLVRTLGELRAAEAALARYQSERAKGEAAIRESEPRLDNPPTL